MPGAGDAQGGSQGPSLDCVQRLHHVPHCRADRREEAPTPVSQANEADQSREVITGMTGQ